MRDLDEIILWPAYATVDLLLGTSFRKPREPQMGTREAKEAFFGFLYEKLPPFDPETVTPDRIDRRALRAMVVEWAYENWGRARDFSAYALMETQRVARQRAEKALEGAKKETPPRAAGEAVDGKTPPEELGLFGPLQDQDTFVTVLTAYFFEEYPPFAKKRHEEELEMARSRREREEVGQKLEDVQRKIRSGIAGTVKDKPKSSGGRGIGSSRPKI